MPIHKYIELVITQIFGVHDGIIKLKQIYPNECASPVCQRIAAKIKTWNETKLNQQRRDGCHCACHHNDTKLELTGVMRWDATIPATKGTGHEHGTKEQQPARIQKCYAKRSLSQTCTTLLLRLRTAATRSNRSSKAILCSHLLKSATPFGDGSTARRILKSISRRRHDSIEQATSRRHEGLNDPFILVTQQAGTRQARTRRLLRSTME